MKKLLAVLSIGLISSLIACQISTGQLGLDTSFATSGFAITDFAGGDDEVFAVAIQPDKKIVAVGRARNQGKYDFAIARFTPEGALDTTFSGDGKLLVDFNSGDDVAYGLVIQPDGKIVVAGTSVDGSSSALAALRIQANGSLDSDFGSDGKITYEAGNRATDGRAIQILPDGSFLIAGSAVSTKPEMLVVKVSALGTLVTPFGTQGVAAIAVGNGEDRAYALAVREDGKIVVAGSSKAASHDQNFAVVRLLATGALDATFGSGGKKTIDIPEVTAMGIRPNAKRNDSAYSLATLIDGRIIVAGDSSSTSLTAARYGALAMLSENGQLDSTYGTNGIQFSQQKDSGFVFGAGSSPLNGELWFIGRLTTGTTHQPALARATSTGMLIGSAASGLNVVNPGGNAAGNALAVGADQRIIGAGYTTTSTGRDFLLFRYSF